MDAFSAVASAAGIGIILDEQPAKETQLSYGRILNQIKADAELPKEVYINMHDSDAKNRI